MILRRVRCCRSIAKRPTAPTATGSLVARTVFDSLESSVAVLAADGTIAMVNKTWERFAVDSGGAWDAIGVGVNYFAVCERSALDEPATTAPLDGLRQVLEGVMEECTVVYPCHPWWSCSGRCEQELSDPVKVRATRFAGRVVVDRDQPDAWQLRDAHGR